MRHGQKPVGMPLELAVYGRQKAMLRTALRNPAVQDEFPFEAGVDRHHQRRIRIESSQGQRRDRVMGMDQVVGAVEAHPCPPQIVAKRLDVFVRHGMPRELAPVERVERHVFPALAADAFRQVEQLHVPSKLTEAIRDVGHHGRHAARLFGWKEQRLQHVHAQRPPSDRCPFGRGRPVRLPLRRKICYSCIACEGCPRRFFPRLHCIGTTGKSQRARREGTPQPPRKRKRLIRACSIPFPSLCSGSPCSCPTGCTTATGEPPTGCSCFPMPCSSCTMCSEWLSRERTQRRPGRRNPSSPRCGPPLSCWSISPCSRCTSPSGGARGPGFTGCSQPPSCPASRRWRERIPQWPASFRTHGSGRCP